MGYDTWYTLRIEQAQNIKQIQQILTFIKNHDEMSYALAWEQAKEEIKKQTNNDSITELYIGGSEQSRWYEYDEDMIKLSLKFPNVLFTLQGEGEEHDDMWKTYYRGGRLQHAPAIITFPPFDVSLLEPLRNT